MKYCKHCGTQLPDEAAYCTNCAHAVELTATTNTSSLKTVAKVFMLIGCIMSGFYFLIPLCWTIPMTMHYWKAVENKTPVETSFKVCSLIFVSLIAGIFMLCDNND